MNRNKKNKGPTSSFLDEWLGGKRRTDIEKLDRHTIRHDSWDMEEYEKLCKELRDFQVSRERLAEVAPASGYSMFGDNYFSLVKAVPKQVDPRNVRPSHIINHTVMGEAMDLDDYEKLHRYSVADDIAAGMAAVHMEPHIEEIFDRLKSEQDAAQQLQQQMADYESLEQALDDLEKALGDMDEEEAEDSDEAADMQAQKALIEQQMEMLRQEMAATAAGIDEGLDDASSDIQSVMRQAMDTAIEAADLEESAAMAWGLDPGGLKKMPADQRLQLAQKLNSEKFRRIAELFGTIQRLAWAEQNRKVYHAAEEIFDIEQGDNLKRTLPAKLARLGHPVLKALFLKDFRDKKILQYKLRGTERVAKGSIIYCEDGSGSMTGPNEIWAKAVGLCLLRIATKQKRDFFGIHFGGTGETMEFDFRGQGFDGEVTTHCTGRFAGTYPDRTYSYIDGVVAFAETHFGGGTDFMTPLSKALDLQREQHDKKGRIDGDIVFVTDGYCGVDQTWLNEFKSEQERLGFRVWGVVIGGRADGEPLNTICDGRVFEIRDLMSGEDFREIFRNI